MHTKYSPTWLCNLHPGCFVMQLSCKMPKILKIWQRLAHLFQRSKFFSAIYKNKNILLLLLSSSSEFCWHYYYYYFFFQQTSKVGREAQYIHISCSGKSIICSKTPSRKCFYRIVTLILSWRVTLTKHQFFRPSTTSST